MFPQALLFLFPQGSCLFLANLVCIISFLFHHLPPSNLRHLPTYYVTLLKSDCRCSQTAGRNSCSIVSGDISNCSYRLTVHPDNANKITVKKGSDVDVVMFVAGIIIFDV